MVIGMISGNRFCDNADQSGNVTPPVKRLKPMPHTLDEPSRRAGSGGALEMRRR
jgi:hypothetical protein